MNTITKVVLVLIVAAPAAAQAPSPRDLYQRGITRYNLGEWKPALDDFREAYRLKPDPAFLFNIAQCYRQLGDPSNAQVEYRAYLRETPDAPNRDEVERLIKAMDEASRAQKQPPTGIAQPSDESLGPKAEARTTVEQRASDLRLRRQAGVGLIGAGAGLVVLGGVFVGLVFKANNDALAGGIYHQNQVTNRNAFEVVDMVSFAVGGAAVVTGLVLYMTGRGHRVVSLSPSYAAAF